MFDLFGRFKRDIRQLKRFQLLDWASRGLAESRASMKVQQKAVNRPVERSSSNSLASGYEGSPPTEV